MDSTSPFFLHRDHYRAMGPPSTRPTNHGPSMPPRTLLNSHGNSHVISRVNPHVGNSHVNFHNSQVTAAAAQRTQPSPGPITTPVTQPMPVQSPPSTTVNPPGPGEFQIRPSRTPGYFWLVGLAKQTPTPAEL